MACLVQNKVIEKKMDRENAFKECLKEVKDELATKILVDKYFLTKDGNYLEWLPSHMWDRLARNIVAAEKEENRELYYTKFRKALDDFKFVPAGRILYGLGNPANITLKNCYVIAIEEDSIKGIFDTAYKMAETYKCGGGCGIDISPLRPSGAPVNNAARVSTGAVSFMDFFSHVTGMIGQKARIGALLICIDVSHPDVEKFIEIKSGDLNLVRYANVSVKISDEFMQAVKNDSDFDLKWGGVTYKTIRAKELWNKLIKHARDRAEPGLLFWDTARRECPADQYEGFNSIATNPCVSGDTRILTEDGYKTARELWAEEQFVEYDNLVEGYTPLVIINKNGEVSSSPVFRTSESEQLYRVTFEDGSYLDTTINHNFIIIDNEGNSKKVKLSEVDVGDRVPLCEHTGFGDFDYVDYALLAGWVIGDGSVSTETNGAQKAHVRCWNEDIENALPKLQESILNVYKRSNKSTNQNPTYDPSEETPDGFNYRKKDMRSVVLGRLLLEDGLVVGNKHVVPKSIWRGTKNTISAFLRGIFSADGGIQINHAKKSASVRLAQSNENILRESQLLLRQLGIDAKLEPRREESEQYMNDGKGGKKLYNRKAQYELIIARRENLVKFAEMIGFVQGWKNDILISWLDAHKGSNNSASRKHLEIKSIEYLGEEETFCLTEPESNEFVANGVRTGNCGEVQLSDGDSCNLGSMNLSKYVSNPFTDRATFNFSKYEEDIKTAVRFLDNIITLEKAPLEFQQAANDNGRRVGLGFMGLADMMAKMRIKFDSEEALKLIDLVSEAHRNASYEASCDLADEKGVFPAYDEEKCFKSPFINRLSGTIKDRIRESGLRNISLNAIAPTGSLSCIARCSSGIEPIFMLKYIRKTNLGTAKKVEEHEVFHPVAEEYTKEHGKELPEYFVEAHQVNPEFRVKMQGIIQKNLDLSISSTVNLKSDATEEDVANIYMQAYDVGCKGITVYRDGSREGVLVKKGSSDTPGNSISVRNAPKRPKELDAEVHVIKPNGKRFAIFVGLMEGKVYEVFALDYKQARCEHGMSGKIIKEVAKKGNVYNFESGALMVRQLNRNEDTDASLITRLISTSLRHGTPLPFVIDQITKSKDGIGSFSRAIARALSSYIDAEEVKGMFTCTECKSKNVKFEGTCFSCLDCGYSRCS